ncbi:MAG: hypothetical protein LC731_01250, partial [Acidobacteria bacterium]|nr:hypothetical protein [Acidobacteriota bacterium]
MVMNDTSSIERAAGARHQVLLIIWLAQFMSLVGFALLSIFVLKPADEDSSSPWLFWVFAFVALTLVLASNFVRQKFFAEAWQSHSPQRLQQGFIIAMALCEAAGLFGLLSRALTSSPYSY